MQQADGKSSHIRQNGSPCRTCDTHTEELYEDNVEDQIHHTSDDDSPHHQFGIAVSLDKGLQGKGS